MSNPFRAGFAALVGRPNVGKSTLLNALIGEKLSIVTPKPQTTRHRVLGILTLPEAQIAFVDTPGLHEGEKRALNRAMNRTAAAALGDADLVVFICEALQWTRADEHALERVRRVGRPCIAVINKTDLAKPRDRLLPFVAELAQRHDFLEIIPMSAKHKDRGSSNLDRLKSVIASHLPESPQLYASEDRTDRDLKFRIAETIREKLTLELNQEVPYGIAVEIESMQEEDQQLVVSAVIWVDREGQKPIVIGAEGSKLKRVGSAARRELNALFGKRFHLTLWVKVREDWADDARALKALGLE